MRLVNFALSSFELHFKVLYESKATLPILQEMEINIIGKSIRFSLPSDVCIVMTTIHHLTSRKILTTHTFPLRGKTGHEATNKSINSKMGGLDVGEV